MIVNNLQNINNSKIKRVITEKTGPETINNLGNGNFGYNNLNSVLKNIDEDRVVKYIKIQKTETAKIEESKMKEIEINDSNKNDKICLNTNINRNSKTNIDLYFLPKRIDRFGIPIARGGKQKVTFIDRITKSNFTEVIKIESFKEYNKMEEVTSNRRNTCCVIL